MLAEPAGEEKNMLIAFLPSRISLHHNLFIAAQQRNPQVTYDDSAARRRDTDTTLDMRNNLLWNWRGGYGARIRYSSTWSWRIASSSTVPPKHTGTPAC